MTRAVGLLESDEWAVVLQEGLGGSHLAIEDGLTRTVWTVFRKYGLAAAYMSFPVGSDVGAGPRLHLEAHTFRELTRRGVDLARFSTASETDGVLREWKGQPLMETAIEDLLGWSEDKLSASLTRKLRKARVSGLSVRPASRRDGSLAYAFYSEAVRRHQGTIRYTQAYFDALCRLSESDPRLSVGVVEDADRGPAAFIVAAHSHRSSHYLHGGFSQRFAGIRPGYLAMVWAIQQSKDFGSVRFNMLTSPIGQPSLVAYKESFGGTSYVRWHYQVPTSASGRAVALAMNLHGRARALASRLG